MGTHYLKLIFTITLLISSCTVGAYELYESTNLLTLLGNRRLIADEAIIWDNKDNIFSQVYKTPDVKILANPYYIHDQLNNIEIIYSNNKRSISLFKENGSYINGEQISNVLKAKYFPILLIETRWQSTGATGDGADGKNLYIYIFNNETIKKTKFKLTENWWSGPFNHNNSSYLLSGESDMYLYLSSFLKTNAYKFNFAELTLSNKGIDQPGNIKPSFECIKAKSKVELAICANPGLATLDSIMSELYRKMQFETSTKQKQLLWLKERNKCNNIPTVLISQCLSAVYRQRIHELQKI